MSIAVPLALYNTLTRRKELFVPLDPSHVRMYVCGPTVYDRVHIGNARPIVVFDILYRLLRQLYPKVTYVRNITDVDDKINSRAIEEGRSINELTDETTRFFHEDITELNTVTPDFEPRATAHIAEMLVMIERLLELGHAYLSGGHVLFSVASSPTYGCLSGRSREEMIAGARVEVAPYKKDPTDFVLWKPSPDYLPGWYSPWGRGRPGWHIECSAMSLAYLGETFDIHGGGQDLIFPHHENEIAQSVCTHRQAFVRYWLHNGWVMLNGKKMSKSLGNFITVRQLLDRGIHGETLRLATISTHYHQPLDWSDDNLRQAKLTLDRFYMALLRSSVKLSCLLLSVEEILSSFSADYMEVLESLCDDLNTPQAITSLHKIVTALNKASSSYDKNNLAKILYGCGKILGILTCDPESWFKKGIGDTHSEEIIKTLISRREEARRAHNFIEADGIREILRRMGVTLNDSITGTTWRLN